MRLIPQSVDASPAVAAPSTVSEHDVAHRLRALRKAGYGTSDKVRYEYLNSRGLDNHKLPAAGGKVDSRLYSVKNQRSSLCRRFRMVSDSVLRVRNGRYAA